MSFLQASFSPVAESTEGCSLISYHIFMTKFTSTKNMFPEMSLWAC